MREVRILRFCDGDHIDKVEGGIERTETLGGEPVVLDFCESCDAAFEKDLATVRAWLSRGFRPRRCSTHLPRPR